MQVETGDRLRMFSSECRELLAQGQVDALIAHVRAAAQERDSTDLSGLLYTDPAVLYIDGWAAIQRHAASARDRYGSGLELSLALVCRSQTAHDDEQGRIAFHFSRDGRPAAAPVPDSMKGDVASIVGLQQHFAFLRQPLSTRAGPSREWDDMLCSWFVIASYVKAVTQRCEADPLAQGLTLLLCDDSTPHSMECGFVDLLPRFRYAYSPRAVASHAAVAALSTSVRHAADVEFQCSWARMMAEKRLLHRMLGLTPLFRFRVRQELAEQWEFSLRIACHSANLQPDPPISWKMSNRELTALLQRILEAKDIPDIPAVLDSAHTDALHRAKVAEAMAEGGVPRGDRATASLFDIHFAYTLLRAGPGLLSRMRRAGPYDPQAQ